MVQASFKVVLISNYSQIFFVSKDSFLCIFHVITVFEGHFLNRTVTSRCYIVRKPIAEGLYHGNTTISIFGESDWSTVAGNGQPLHDRIGSLRLSVFCKA